MLTDESPSTTSRSRQESLDNEKYQVHDFWSTPKQLAANITSPDLLGACGFNCTGYDTCYILNEGAPKHSSADWQQAPVATLASPWSGIQLDIYTDQHAMQVYTCNNMNGNAILSLPVQKPVANTETGTCPLKKTQGISSRPKVVEKYGCVVLEVEDWIDGINNPQWERDRFQIFGPVDGPYVLQATYKFSLTQNVIGSN